MSKVWPDDGKVVDFEDLVEPVCEAIKEAYELVPRDYGERINWNGFALPKFCRATCFPYEEKLTREQLEYSEECQGRDPLREIVAIAVQLGAEQGQRMLMSDGRRRNHIERIEDSLRVLKGI